MNKRTIIRLAILLFVATALLILFFVWKKVFSGELTHSELMMALCDGFFIVSVLYLSFAALQFVSSRGEFDSFGYGIKTFFRTHKPSRQLDVTKQTYADYVEEKNKTRRFKADIELYIGLALLVVALVFFLLFKFS